MPAFGVMQNQQPRVTPKAIQLRLLMAKNYVAITRAFMELAAPDASLIDSLDTLMVLLSVFIGDCEGRPMSATKIADFAGIPRATVYRRLEELLKINKITKVGKSYVYAADAMNPDKSGQLNKILNRMAGEVSTLDSSALD